MVEQPALFAAAPIEPNAATQCADVLDYIRQRGSITPLVALREFGCMRLAARIYDLRRAGWDITETTQTATNFRGKPVSFSRYSLTTGTS